MCVNRWLQFASNFVQFPCPKMADQETTIVMLGTEAEFESALFSAVPNAQYEAPHFASVSLRRRTLDSGKLLNHGNT